MRDYVVYIDRVRGNHKAELMSRKDNRTPPLCPLKKERKRNKQGKIVMFTITPVFILSGSMLKQRNRSSYIDENYHDSPANPLLMKSHAAITCSVL